MTLYRFLLLLRLNWTLLLLKYYATCQRGLERRSSRLKAKLACLDEAEAEL